jgi:chorismate dehydratase
MKIGQTYFKNTDFIYYPLVHGKLSANIEYVRAHPPELGEMLKKGDVDIAPTSSILYAQNSQDFWILPDFSISALGKTMSIILFSEKFSDWEELEGNTVAIPGTSASSSALLQIILEMKGIEAEFVFHKDPDLNAMLRHADSALLIGDDALKAFYEGRKAICDLGEEWKNLTHKKMVYAFWVIGKKAAVEKKNEISNFYKVLSKSKEMAYQEIELICRELAREINVSPEFMMSHLKTLDYNLDEKCKEAAIYFFEKACDCGLLNDAPSLKIYEV